MSDDATLLLATETDATKRLADALGAVLEPLPALDATDAFEAFRASASEGARHARVVVCVWLDGVKPAELETLDDDAWQRRFEAPYLLWNFALGAASKRCADGGSIVSLCQAPAALDAPGLTPELAIADGVLALVRSVAAKEGGRRVRSNLVTTPLGLVEGEVIAPPPPLPDFPPPIEVVAGTIRSLLSPDAAAITGRLLSADGGRSL